LHRHARHAAEEEARVLVFYGLDQARAFGNGLREGTWQQLRSYASDDQTRGGYARIATVIATRKQAREGLNAGDFSRGTPFAAASREIGGEL
jgi:hypothetical protein